MAPYDREGMQGPNLEDEFFHREDQKLIARLRELRAAEDARTALARVSGIKNPAVLDKLVALGIQPEMVAALFVVPLVEVAWADGSFDAKERAAVLEHAKASGFTPGSAELALLEAWLDRKPEARVFTAWQHLVEGLRAEFEPAQMEKLRSTLIERAQGVARASGGVLGIGKISKAEAAALARLEKAFQPA
jgi:hypothetical protein